MQYSTQLDQCRLDFGAYQRMVLAHTQSMYDQFAALQAQLAATHISSPSQYADDDLSYEVDAMVDDNADDDV